MNAQLADILDDLDGAVDELPVCDAPAILGALERLRARLWTRLYQSATTRPAPAQAKPDRLLDADEVADVLGVKARWVREHADEIGSRVRMPGNALRFSERKLQRWIEQRSP